MYDRVLVITINSYYSKVPSTGTAVLLRSIVPTTGKRLFNWLCTWHFALCDWINEGEATKSATQAIALCKI